MQPEYMLMLSSVLVDESSQLHVRNAAGLALKNALSARVRTSLPQSSFFLLTLIFSYRRRAHGKLNTRLDGSVWTPNGRPRSSKMPS
jgi:hypothetical protein